MAPIGHNHNIYLIWYKKLPKIIRSIFSLKSISYDKITDSEDVVDSGLAPVIGEDVGVLSKEVSNLNEENLRYYKSKINAVENLRYFLYKE